MHAIENVELHLAQEACTMKDSREAYKMKVDLQASLLFADDQVVRKETSAETMERFRIRSEIPEPTTWTQNVIVSRMCKKDGLRKAVRGKTLRTV